MIPVCIIEDIIEIQHGLQQIITADSRFSWAGSFSNAEDATQQLPLLSPQIVIVDIHLPGKSGIECISIVKPLMPATQFIIFTIYEDDDKIFEALKAGANGYLLKNTPPEKIIEALLEMHEGGSPMSSKIARKIITSLRESPSLQTNDQLTNRENEVIGLLSKGMLYKEIADKFGISTSTIKKHIGHIYEKLHVQNRTEALNKLYRKK